jgi:CMP-2-keto-3-deoxyoctulosonic acid synthetase
MTSELVARVGLVDYRGDRPCVPQEVMVKVAVALEQPRRRLVEVVMERLKEVCQEHE